MKFFLLAGLVAFCATGLWAQQVPVISSFTPTFGPVGTTVTINGSNFTNTPASNIVYFGATKAIIQSGNSSQLIVTVPVGATYEPISVTESGSLTGYSSMPFDVTFPSPGTMANSFDSPENWTVDNNPQEIAFGDLNGDGKGEVITAVNSTGLIYILKNTNTSGTIDIGSFLESTLTANISPSGLALGDLNGDGKLDIATAGNGPVGSGLTIFSNTTIGATISFATVYNFYFAGAWGIAISDIDKDGKPDIIVSRNSTNVIRVYRNIGSSPAFGFDTGTEFSTGAGPTGLAAMDLNKDGMPEVVTANSGGGGSISVLENNSSGSISFKTRFDISGSGTPSDIAIADMDNSGLPDLVVGYSDKAQVSVLRNKWTLGTMSSADFDSGKDFTNTASQTPTLVVADFDGDGRPDIAAASGTAIFVYKNTVTSAGTLGSNSFATPVSFSVSSGVNLAAGDVDSDGIIDLLVSNQSDSKISIIRNKIADPEIQQMNPGNGTPGTPITITGKNFSTRLLSNIVKFGGVAGTITAATGTSITVKVPIIPQGTVATSLQVGLLIATGPNFIVDSDSATPTVTQNTTPVAIAPATDVVVTALFNGTGSPIDTARVLYRPIAGALPNNFVSVDMSNSAGSFSGTIPKAAVTELGVEYKFYLKDGAGNAINPADQTLYKTAIYYSIGLPVTSYPSTASGDKPTNYRIITIPLEESRTVNDVFNDFFGGYDPTAYRLFKYNGSTFTELNASSVLTAGEGYWFIKLSSLDFNTGPGTTVDVSTASPFTITLDPGWNQIGNPYNFSIAWSDVIAANPAEALNLGGNNSLVRVYRGSSDDKDVLKSFEGGFVRYLGSISKAIKIPVAKNAGIQGRKVSIERRITKPLDQPEWEILFEVEQGDMSYKLGGVGMHPEAKEGFDYHDNFNAPRFFDYLEVKFPKSLYGMTFTKDIVATSENFTWEFSVESNLKEEGISISWDNSYFGNAKEIYLLDVATHRATDMRSENHYHFKRSESKDFRVVFGNAQYVKEELVPDRVVLFDPYPNPFTDRVAIEYALPKEANESDGVIEICSIMGSTVSKMNTPNQAGPGRWVWESEGQSSGLYIVKLKMGMQSVTRKLIKQ